MSYTNTTPANPRGGTDYYNNGAVLIGSTSYVFPWIATARKAYNNSNLLPSKIQQAFRTASTCYMRGLKECVQITTNSGKSWQWRRVCFTLKGKRLTQFEAAGRWLSLETSNGQMRVVNDTNSVNIGLELTNLVFDGRVGSDWSNIFNAKTDQDKISVKYDRTRTISSGNSDGMIRNYKMWHPMNKNLNYDDDERGEEMDGSQYSTEGRQGMGDYYVVDFFTCVTGGTSSDQLIFNPEATLYWHEK